MKSHFANACALTYRDHECAESGCGAWQCQVCGHETSAALIDPVARRLGDRAGGFREFVVS